MVSQLLTIVKNNEAMAEKMRSRKREYLEEMKNNKVAQKANYKPVSGTEVDLKQN